MNSVLTAASLIIIAYSIYRIPSRPGLFAGVIASTFAYSIYFGPLGAMAAVVAYAAAVFRFAGKGMVLLRSEVFLLLWLAGCLVSLAAAVQIDIATYYGGALFALAMSTYTYARAYGTHETFMMDMLLSCSAAAVLCAPPLLASLASPHGVGATVVYDIPVVGWLAYLFFGSGTRWRNIGAGAFLAFVVLPMDAILGKRSVFLSFILVLLAYLALRRRSGNLGRLLRGIAGSVALMVAGGTTAFFAVDAAGLSERLLGRATRVSMIFLGGSGEHLADRSVLFRMSYYKQALDLISQSPLFGYSVGAFEYLANNATGYYPHNMFLELLVNTGIVGTAFFVAWSASLTYSSARSAAALPHDMTQIFIFGLIIESASRLQVSMSIVNGKLLYIALGMVAAFAEQKKDAVIKSASRNIVRGAFSPFGPD